MSKAPPIWSEEEDNLLRELVAKNLRSREISAELLKRGYQRSYEGVKKRAQKLRLNPRKSGENVWQPEELACLKELVDKGYAGPEISRVLKREFKQDRSIHAINKRRLKMGWRWRNQKAPSDFAPWTERETAKLREMYDAGIPYAQMADRLGRTLGAVKDRRAILGLAPRRYTGKGKGGDHQPSEKVWSNRAAKADKAFSQAIGNQRFEDAKTHDNQRVRPAYFEKDWPYGS